MTVVAFNDPALFLRNLRKDDADPFVLATVRERSELVPSSDATIVQKTPAGGVASSAMSDRSSVSSQRYRMPIDCPQTNDMLAVEI